MAKKKNNSKIMDTGVAVLMATGGGIAGNQVCNILEGMNIIPSKFVGATTAVLGSAIAVFAPEKFKPFGYGMAAQGGTELFEDLTSSTAKAPITPIPGAVLKGYNNLEGMEEEEEESKLS